MEVEKRWHAMGTNVHVVINGTQEHLTYARRRLDELENKWSRFIPSSEITKMNNNESEPFEVSEDTATLIRRALEGYEITNGLFNPTILGDLIRLGYSSSFEKIEDKPQSNESKFIHGDNAIHIDENNIVTLDPDTGFDPGGIGKGLAADLIAEELIRYGASGALINVGGDVRIDGIPPEGSGWKVEIADSDDSIIDTVVLNEGAVATSTTKKRTWDHNGEKVNHLIDPKSGKSVSGDIVLASVISAKCWQAEILTKFLMLEIKSKAFEKIEDLGAQGLVCYSNGKFETTSGWSDFNIK